MLWIVTNTLLQIFHARVFILLQILLSAMLISLMDIFKKNLTTIILNILIDAVVNVTANFMFIECVIWTSNLWCFVLLALARGYNFFWFFSALYLGFCATTAGLYEGHDKTPSSSSANRELTHRCCLCTNRTNTRRRITSLTKFVGYIPSRDLLQPLLLLVNLKLW